MIRFQSCQRIECVLFPEQILAALATDRLRFINAHMLVRQPDGIEWEIEAMKV
jgi:hypothetical protein